MSYEKALQAAGAEVLVYEEFGSYQGDWWAKVRYNGELGWVQGSFGSCSGCDAFEAEFFMKYEGCSEHSYYPEDDCQACKDSKIEYSERLAEFGRGYLDGLLTQENAEKEATRNLGWDGDAQEMLDWIKSNALTK